MPLWKLHGPRRGGLTARDATPGAPRRRPRWRAGLIAGVALAHLLLLAWLSESTRPTPPPPRLTIIGMTDGARLGLPSGLRRASIKPPRPPKPLPEQAASTPPPPPVKPPPSPDPGRLAAGIEPTPPDLTAEPTEIDVAAARDLNRRLLNAGAAGAPRADPECGISQRLAQDLERDRAVVEAVDAIRPEALSVARAAVVWSNGWAPAADLGGAAVRDPIRGRITESLASVSPDCLARPVLGPRFMVVRSRTGSTVLTVGSGAWRWSDLLTPDPRSVP